MSYMIPLTLTVGLLTNMIGCGSTKESHRSETTKSGDDEGYNVSVGNESVQFEITPPQDDQAGFALKTLSPPDTGDMPPDEEKPSPTPEPVSSSRIKIRCKNPSSGQTSPSKPAMLEDVGDEETESQKPLGATFEIGLEENSGDDASYERTGFPYTCGSAGAIVIINKLQFGSVYRIDASYLAETGRLTHQGETEQFKLGSDGNAYVKLVMKKVTAKKGKAKVDVVFEDDDTKPFICAMQDYACADIFQPVICEASASSASGNEIALILGPVKGSNKCEAQRELEALACSEKVVIEKIFCEPVK